MPAPYVLVYDAPAKCPVESQVRDDVASHVHDDSRAAGVQLTLRITRTPSGFSGELVVVDVAGKSGRRAIEGTVCGDVSHALAFLAGLAIDLGGHFEEDETPAPPPPERAPPPPSPPPPERPSPPTPPGWSLGLTFTGRGAIGPNASPGGELFIGLESRRGARSALRGSLLVGGNRVEGPFGSADLVLFGARIEGCPIWIGSRSLGVRPCGGLEAGAIATRSIVPVDPRSPTLPWLAADLALHVEWSFASHVFLEWTTGFVFPILRTHFFFQERDRSLYTVPEVTARTGLSFGVHFF
jgi:hypothetical protein